MTQQPPTGDHFSISIGGAVTGSQVGAGHTVEQHQENHTTHHSDLHKALTNLRGEIAALAEGGNRAEADALLDELQSEADAGRPVQGIGARLRQWIAAHTPGLLETVTTVVVPLAVQAAAAAASGAVTDALPPGN
ncbi:hypothetical protein BM536_036440 [Streptomyces phaeoluteigriseus]|uniref:Uncharacterized protein n=1 Tax=Streptomyces phaeoluteigriseus TaxID=114686 RepID=A0A1V6MHZ8_9ACTN|nr:hypothetical protein [Streptomyces phaeoluteigriseus]OQD52100.1 hypothetical protein BM536_036440 [Streptomyces phaeoluteigriseus]